MYVSDYYYGAEPSYWALPGYSSSGPSYDYRAALSVNWLALGASEWTISCGTDNTYDAFYVNGNGSVHNGTVYYYTLRPAFYLKSTVAYSTGIGTSQNPIRIEV